MILYAADIAIWRDDRPELAQTLVAWNGEVTGPAFQIYVGNTEVMKVCRGKRKHCGGNT